MDRLVISSPCTEPWEGMRGDDRTRHCRACRLDVHNVEAMTRDEVEHLLGTSAGRICARIYRRPDGTVLTKDCVPERGRVARRLQRMRVAMTAVLALVGLAGCRSAPQSTVTLGVVALPPDYGMEDAPVPVPEAQARQPVDKK